MINTIEIIKNIHQDLELLLKQPEMYETITNSFTQPTEIQLAKINELIGWNSEKESWLIVNFRASDNLVNRSYRRWSLNILNLMKIKCVENPLIIDHEWSEAKNSCGLIINAELVKTNIAPKNQKLGYEEINQRIINKEGYVSLILTAAIPLVEDNEWVIDAIKTRKIDSCSTGGEIEDTKLICPHCSEDYGRVVTFTETDKMGNYICPHLIPYSWSRSMRDDEEYQVADYVELDGNYENLELSLCNIGNLPNAKIIR